MNVGAGDKCSTQRGPDKEMMLRVANRGSRIDVARGAANLTLTLGPVILIRLESLSVGTPWPCVMRASFMVESRHE